jgi:hypothetical protein
MKRFSNTYDICGLLKGGKSKNNHAKCSVIRKAQTKNKPRHSAAKTLNLKSIDYLVKTCGDS